MNSPKRDRTNRHDATRLLRFRVLEEAIALIEYLVLALALPRLNYVALGFGFYVAAVLLGSNWSLGQL